ncbi:alkene reductase [Xenorhabdus mauleonii]|uniref:Alkene reductase n=2 Tax=Xenorhabdus mauleonii TaxID=351675 RepID=A0A1I3N5P9_9GAMM|nr:alkene reductase [Xenorhabdus mauleonii]PHM45778.1 alkene reductase [Xenorhabdus mauleonii]SFJ04405.1 N-ethylmaleimide reductase [Xenorhabdus mauleonii]
MTSLFTPIRIGSNTLKNRLVMAPMTRSRSNDEGIQSELAATYYGQRAEAGLIITECTYVSSLGKGYVRAPGIETTAQVAAWKKVTDAVHANGGQIFIQLWHSGRISHPSLLPDNATPVGPSAIKPAGQVWTLDGPQDMVTPQALEINEIADIVSDFGLATAHAMGAGFDGVELHAASGFLPEQFLSSGSNNRQDQYGGSVENRVRFTLEVLDAMIAEAGSDRVGIKISPEMNFNDITDTNPQETYTYLVDQLNGRNLAYLHVALFGTPVDYHGLLRPRFEGAYLMGGGLDQKSATEALIEGRADAVVFGNAFLANPDLPERFRQSAQLNAPNKETFYTPGPQGYIDYPLNSN